MSTLPPPAESPNEASARRLLANAATGELPQLKALVFAYPYHHLDLRPLDALIPFLLVPPPSLPTRRQAGVTALQLQAVVKALTCIEVIHQVGHAARSALPSSHAFSDVLKQHWASVISWLTFTVEFSAENMARDRMIVAVSSVAQLLADFTWKPFNSRIILGACSATVDLAFRVWSGEFTQGRIFTKATCALAEFFSNCLEMGDVVVVAAMLEHVEDPNRSKSFFKLFTAHIVKLDRNPTSSAKAFQIIEAHAFYVIMMQSLPPSTIWKNAWKWTVKQGTLKAHIRAIHTLLSAGTMPDQREIACVGGLITTAERDDTGTLSRLRDLSLSGIVPLLYRCLREMPEDLPSKHTARVILLHMSSYLPYPKVSRAIVQSLEPYIANIRSDTPRHDASWKYFYSTLKLSALGSEARNAFYAFACDNIKTFKKHAMGPLGSIRRHPPEERALGALQHSIALRSAKGMTGKLSIVTSAPVPLNISEVCRSIRIRRKTHKWFPSGSRGNLGAVLIQFFNLLCLKGLDVSSKDSVSTVDWNLGAPSGAGSLTKEEYIAISAERQPAYTRPRMSAMISSASRRNDLRLAEGTYRHGNEYIHVLAILQEGHWPSGYVFLHGVGMMSPAPDSDQNLDSF
ncbi:hypothetical protein DFP72DRAFT_1077356 [Ephemerocybe angulata]|uniref:Uncharacterized protein n=1 Tax=Ephemerocybe angulata TaxID=980116 RepID=A0A8H6LVL8_9AGAR|nr:hypothetical protein DFP72DRAFT_1077356 [Tulosesus angulatus]